MCMCIYVYMVGRWGGDCDNYRPQLTRLSFRFQVEQILDILNSADPKNKFSMKVCCHLRLDLLRAVDPFLIFATAGATHIGECFGISWVRIHYSRTRLVRPILARRRRILMHQKWNWIILLFSTSRKRPFRATSRKCLRLKQILFSPF